MAKASFNFLLLELTVGNFCLYLGFNHDQALSLFLYFENETAIDAVSFYWLF